MPKNEELLKSLRSGFEQLELFDRARLNSLRNRGQMIIGRVFGPDSPYIASLSSVEFRYLGIGFGTFQGGESPATKQARQRAWLRGKEESIALIDTMLEDLELGEFELPEPELVETGYEPTGPKSDRVFVVHGHDEEMRESVARVLTALGLEPVILHEQPNRGRTVIEKFYDYSDVGFAVVLLSPDDIGHSISAGADTAKPRARQNVILELGYFLGKLGRENVVAVHKGDVEIPSDYSGVLFTPYVTGGDWRYKLTRELRASGYSVSADVL